MTADAALKEFSAKFERAQTRRPGSILLRLTGKNGGQFYLYSTATGCRVSREPAEESPHVQVSGPADRILAILSGRKEGRSQFIAGGIRVRGDLDYLSALAHEMGLIKEPF
jgi:hypothetical protein